MVPKATKSPTFFVMSKKVGYFLKFLWPKYSKYLVFTFKFANGFFPDKSAQNKIVYINISSLLFDVCALRVLNRVSKVVVDQDDLLTH